MSELQVFNNAEFGSVRTMSINGEPYFVGKDVASILGYAKPLNALAMHVDEDDSLKQGLIDSMGRQQDTILINESGKKIFLKNPIFCPLKNPNSRRAKYFWHGGYNLALQKPI